MVGGLVVPAGTVFAGVSLTARDFVHDALGARGVGAGIAVGAGLSAMLVSARMAVASVMAFIVSEAVDTVVYARLRDRGRLGAIAGSNLGGLVVDSVVFVPLAFGSTAAIGGQILSKTLATVLTLAAFLVGKRIARWVVRS